MKGQDKEQCQVAAVIPIAGRGRRMQADQSKGLLMLAGRPVLAWTISPLIFSGLLDVLVIVARPEEFAAISLLIPETSPVPTAMVPGGAERSDSVRAGLEWLSGWNGWLPGARHLAAVHDGARPLASRNLWHRVVLAALHDGGAVPGLPMADTLKRSDTEGYIEETIERTGLWQVQTPQVFEFERLLAAHRRAHQDGMAVTDDAQIWEFAGERARLVPGERENFKITTREDLALAEKVLRWRSEEAAAGGVGL